MIIKSVTFLLITLFGVSFASVAPPALATSVTHPTTAAALSQQQLVDNYFAQSQLRFLNERQQEIIKDALNQPPWPGNEAIKRAEQFFWNLPRAGDATVQSLFRHPQNLNWQQFTTWVQTLGWNLVPKLELNIRMLPVYQAFPDATQQGGFLTWIHTFFNGVSQYDLIDNMDILLLAYQTHPNDTQQLINRTRTWIEDPNDMRSLFAAMCSLLTVRQAFPNIAQQNAFLKWAKLFFRRDESVILSHVDDLLKIYQATQRNNFTNWALELLIGVPERHIIDAMHTLLGVYIALPDTTQRNDFIKRAPTLLDVVSELDRIDAIKHSLSLYQTLPDVNQRTAFTNWTKPWLNGIDQDNRIRYIYNLLAAYQAFPDATQRDGFLTWAQTLVNAMQAPIPGGTLDMLHEITGLLPVYQAFPDATQRDGFLTWAQTLINAMPQHDLRHVIKDGLLRMYQAFSDTAQRDNFPAWATPLLNSSRAQNLSTAIDVLAIVYKDQPLKSSFDDFISPHHRILGAVSLVFDDLISSFIPRNYLCYVRALAALNAEPVVRENHAQAVYATTLDNFLPTLDAADLLMQRQVAAVGVADADMELRIQAAPMKAASIFSAMQGAPNVRELWHKHIDSGTAPELFELYQAYYNGLYCRKPILDADGKLTFGTTGRIRYQKDEHILERDNRGNMVSKYNPDGSLRRNETTGAEEPLIVYYQAEFAVLEHEFTKHMQAEFEEQRGLVY